MPAKDIENSIIVRILPVQVPQLWEVLKFACVQTDEVDQSNIPRYLNELLHALLSNKAQCFIRLGEDRTLLMLVLTRIMFDKFTGEKDLFVQCLYSFKAVEDEIWKRGIQLIEEFARKEGCRTVSFNSRRPRIWEVAKLIGFTEKHRVFSCEVGGEL